MPPIKGANTMCEKVLDFIQDGTLEQVFRDIPYPGDSFEMSRNTKDEHTYNSFGKSLVQWWCLLAKHILNGRIGGGGGKGRVHMHSK